MSDLSINIFFLIVSTTLTGSLVQFIWIFVKKLFGNKNPFAVYMGLRIVCMSYVIPIVYMLSYHYFHNSFFYVNKQDNILKDLQPIPIMKEIFIFLAIIWMCLFFVILCYRIAQYLKWRFYIKWKRRETEKEILKKLEECGKRLSMKKLPSIYRKEELSTPLCTGVFKKIILLPEKNYNEEELEVIFMHELTHIKKHDLELKWLSVIITMIHCFNPMVYKLFYQISIWSEIRCDIYACEKSKGIFTIKNYYNTILKMMLQNKKVKDFVITALAEKSSDITIRICYMKNYKKTKEKMKIIAAGIMLSSLLVSFFASCALVTGILNHYDKFIKNNFLMNVEAMDSQMENKVHNINQIEGMEGKEWIEKIAENGKKYIWNLSLDNIYKIKNIYCDSKTKIKIYCSIFDGCDKDILVGIIEPNGNVRFIENRDGVLYMFDVEESGEYNIFIQNLEPSDIKVYFSYYLKDKK